MRNGVPVAACNLPGVRQPVMMTGMGEVTEVGDAAALAEAIIRILSRRADYQQPSDQIAASFAPEQTAAEYIRLFDALRHGHHPPPALEPPAYERLRAMKEAQASMGAGAQGSTPLTY